MAESPTEEAPEQVPFRQRVRECLLIFKQTPRVLRLVWQAYPAAAVVVPLLTILIGPLPAVWLYCTKKVLDGVGVWIEGDAATGRHIVVLYLSVGFGLMLVQRALGSVNRFFREMLRSRLTHTIQGEIIDRAVGLDIGFFETPGFYDKLQRAKREAGFRPWSILESMVQGIQELTMLCGYLVVLMTLAWWTAPYLLLAALPGLVVSAKFGRLGFVIVSGRTPEERRMWYYNDLLTSDGHAKEVRLFGLAGYLMRQWREVFWQFYRQDRSLSARRISAEFGAVLVQTLATLGFYAFAVYRTVTDPVVTVGSLVMHTQAMERSLGSMSSVLRSIGGLYENHLYLSNLFEYLEQGPEIVAPAEPKPVRTPMLSGVRFESVSFQYPGGSEDVLEGVSFELAAGENVALVGENGAGKTTIIKLLARLYDPGSGRITVDGTDLRELDPAQWRSQIGVIFQDFSRYHVTARENVGFGEIAYVDDIERIRAAADASGATAAIEKLEHGWENILGKWWDEGQELSSGEWQRIALARAFLREAQVLVLDEPTASLDAKQEYDIFARFSELTEGKTTVLISHRFSTVRMADRIIVIEKGRVAESGSHAELMTLGGTYADLFTRQASRYR